MSLYYITGVVQKNIQNTQRGIQKNLTSELRGEAMGEQEVRWQKDYGPGGESSGRSKMLRDSNCDATGNQLRRRDAPGEKEDVLERTPDFTTTAPRAPQNTPSLSLSAQSPRSKLPDLNIQVRSCQKATPRVA